jgi:hypothetical protein
MMTAVTRTLSGIAIFLFLEAYMFLFGFCKGYKVAWQGGKKAIKRRTEKIANPQRKTSPTCKGNEVNDNTPSRSGDDTRTKTTLPMPSDSAN